MTANLTIDELLTTTRAVRRRLDLTAPVDLAEINECLRMALQAPSGSNEQTWHWIVVTDPDVRNALGALYQDAYAERRARPGTGAAQTNVSPERARMKTSSVYLGEHIAEAPVHIVPCVTAYMPEFPGDEKLRESTLWASIYPAVWSLQLALRSRGYGTCLTTLHLMRHQQAAELLGVPDGYLQACLLPVARIKGANVFREAPRKPFDEVVSYNHF